MSQFDSTYWTLQVSSDVIIRPYPDAKFNLSQWHRVQNAKLMAQHRAESTQTVLEEFVTPE